MIQIKNLSKSFGKNVIFTDVNIDMRAGVVHGVVGKNGAGKTTLFNCIAGLSSYEGQISSPFEDIKNVLGLLPTNPIFPSKITGAEYLNLVCIARKIPLESYKEKNIFNLPLNSYAENYSTGMKKKLALLGILLQKNKIFILDEPFNGVDMESNQIILDIIQTLKSLDKYIIISSHIFGTLKEISDQILLIESDKKLRCIEQKDFGLLDKNMRSIFHGKLIQGLGLE